MILDKLYSLLDKVFKRKVCYLPCGLYGAVRMLTDSRRRRDAVEGEDFTMYRCELGGKLLRPFFVVKGTMYEAEDCTEMEYGIYPDISVLCYSAFLFVAFLVGLIALIAGARAGLFLFSAIALNVILYGVLVWQGGETAQRFQRSMVNKSRRYTGVLPE